MIRRSHSRNASRSADVVDIESLDWSDDEVDTKTNGAVAGYKYTGQLLDARQLKKARLMQCSGMTSESIKQLSLTVDTEDSGEFDDEESNEPQSVLLSVDAENSSLIDPHNKQDHRRTKLFSGAVTADRIFKDPRREPMKHLRLPPLASQQQLPPVGNRSYSPLKATHPAIDDCPVKDFVLPIPTLPSAVLSLLGRRTMEWLWHFFLQDGADESELVEVKQLRWQIIDKMRSVHCPDLPFDRVALLQAMDDDDFIEFSALAKGLAEVVSDDMKVTDKERVLDHDEGGVSTSPIVKNVQRRLNIDDSDINYLKNASPHPQYCYVCCSLTGCNHQQSDARAKDFKEQMDRKHAHLLSSEEYRLHVVLSELKQTVHPLSKSQQRSGKLSGVTGVVRNRDLLRAMQMLQIPFDKTRLPRSFWELRGDLLLDSVEQLQELIDTMRTDRDVIIDPMDAIYKYELPQWLKEEFKPSEILLYEHHFTLIDKDGGGTIDAEELQVLIQNFGSTITMDEAQEMLDEYDMDGSGTIDFMEFMVLIYKIQRGVIDLSTSDFGKLLAEAKSQLRIFEEIEIVSKDPPQYCTVENFGGSPITCEFSIEGPECTPYEGFVIKLQFVLHDGYPYRQPDIHFHGRVPGLHIMPQLSGDARLMHMKHAWSSDWNISSLLEHIVTLLKRPDPALLPSALHEIYTHWECEYRRLVSQIVQQHDTELQQELQELKTMSSEDLRPISAQEDKAAAAGNAAAAARQLRQSEDEKKPSWQLKEKIKNWSRTLSVEKLSTTAAEQLIRRLSRLEQMHLRTMFLFLTSEDDLYFDMIKTFMEKYAAALAAADDEREK